MISYNDNARDYIARQRNARSYLYRKEQEKQQKEERSRKRTEYLIGFGVWLVLLTAIGFLAFKGLMHSFDHWRMFGE